jgi:hypothetical protein
MDPVSCRMNKFMQMLLEAFRWKNLNGIEERYGLLKTIVSPIAKGMDGHRQTPSLIS